MKALLANWKAEFAANRGKSIALGFCLVAALWTWCGVLLGGEPVVPSGATESAWSGPEMTPSMDSPAAPSARVQGFDEAWGRLRKWSGPLGLAVNPAAELEVMLPGAPKIEEKSFNINLPQLTGTAVLGPVRWAFLDGVAVQEGSPFGRYFIADVQPREIVLLDGNRSIVLRMESWNSSLAQNQLKHP